MRASVPHAARTRSAASEHGSPPAVGRECTRGRACVAARRRRCEHIGASNETGAVTQAASASVRATFAPACYRRPRGCPCGGERGSPRAGPSGLRRSPQATVENPTGADLRRMGRTFPTRPPSAHWRTHASRCSRALIIRRPLSARARRAVARRARFHPSGLCPSASARM